MMARGRNIHFDHVLLKPHEQIGLHSQPSWELSYIIKGGGMRQTGGTIEAFGAGEVVLVPPEMPHWWHFDESQTDADGNVENISLTFMPDFLESLSSAIPEFQELSSWFANLGLSLKYENGIDGTMCRLLESMVGQTEEERMVSLLRLLLMIKNSATHVVAGVYVNENKIEMRLNKINVFVSCNFSRGITVEDIARHVGMNRSALCKFYKQNAGRTLFDTIIDYRLDKAKYLLKSDNRRVAEICYECGFGDVSYFCRLFGKVVGMSPLVYRKQTQG